MVINRACNIDSLCRPSNRADARLCDAGLIGHDRKTNVRPIVFRRDFDADRPTRVVANALLTVLTISLILWPALSETVNDVVVGVAEL